MRASIKSLIFACLLTASTAFADTCSDGMMPTFPGAQATAICNRINGGTLTSPTISGNLTFSTATAKIIPGATSLTFRNNADSADNLSITDAGAIGLRNSVTFSGGNTITSQAAQNLTLNGINAVVLQANGLERWRTGTTGALTQSPNPIQVSSVADWDYGLN